MNNFEYVKSKESKARTYADNFPISIVAGKGSYLFDENKNEYLDFLSGAGTLALGHNNPKVKDTVISYLNTDGIIHGLDYTTPAKKEFIESLLNTLPINMRNKSRIQFCGPTGSDAVEAAIKLCKINTKRDVIIAFHGSYHGMSQGNMAITGDLSARNGLNSLLPNVQFLPAPYFYRYASKYTKKEYNNFLESYIEEVFYDPNSGISKPAAVIIETVQGEGGCIPIEISFLKLLRKVTKNLDIPLIIDEVQTGIGRTGKMYGFEHSEIIPDVVVISKAAGGGFPLSVIIYDEKLDTWGKGSHAGTFRGNQLAFIAGKTTIDIVNKKGFLENVKKKGDLFVNGLMDINKKYRFFGEIRHSGLMIGAELDKKYTSREKNKIISIIKSKLFQNGLIVESGGRDNSVLRFLPPLNITEHDLKKSLIIISKVLEEVKNDKKITSSS